LVYNTTAGAGHNASTGCLQVTSDFTVAGNKGELDRGFASGTNFTGKTITVWINIPADLVSATTPNGVQMYLMDSNYVWGDTDWINITAAGWQKFEWVLPATLVHSDITAIRKLGIQVTSGTGSPVTLATEPLLFDDINW
jgi:hypothetical protein